MNFIQYPCTSPRAEFSETKISSDPVTAIRFMFEDAYLVSLAGSEVTLMRWKLNDYS